MPKRLSQISNANCKFALAFSLVNVLNCGIKSGRCLCSKAQNAKPSFHDVVKFRTLTFEYSAVFI